MSLIRPSRCLPAVSILTSIGFDRAAAQTWFELGGLLEEVGEFDAARDAYRSAAASSGLQTRPTLKVANREPARGQSKD